MFSRKVILAITSNFILFGLFLLAPAGEWAWGRAWVVLALIVIGTAATMWSVFRHDEELLKERMKSPFQKGQPLVDKVLVILLLTSLVVVLLVTPIDVFRFHLLPAPPLFVSYLGLFFFVFGWVIISLTFRANTFAAPVVKHQSERHQIVIDHGVYRFVRHPMYIGTILFLIGMTLWLGSTTATLLCLVPALILAIRITFEERFLRQHLQGYENYTRRVRFRMIPGIW